MPWWSWIILGALLLGAELMVVDAAFYLVFIGAAAVITGLISLSGIVMPLWVQWLVFAGLSAIAMVLFRERLYKKLRSVTADYPSGPVGETLELDTTLASGAKGRQKFQGSAWYVENTGTDTLMQGTRVTVLRVQGNTLIVSATNNH